MEEISSSILGGSGIGAGAFGVLDRVHGAVEMCSVPAGERGVDGWMALIGEVSQALTVLAAARDAAIVRLAAIEEVVTEDGVIGEQVNGLGTVCLDAGAMVATATGTSSRFGQELVDQAVTRVVRVPALHEAMLEGVLDDYKARRLAGELGDVPPDLARAVLDALAGELASKSGAALQRKVRAMLMALCPDLLRGRIRNARRGVALRRWMGEPGTDSWGGSFPSERAAVAWAGVDAVARRYRLEGRYETLEQARAYALLDLVEGNITGGGGVGVGGSGSADVGPDVEGDTSALSGSGISGQAQSAGGEHVHVGAPSGGTAFLRPRAPDSSGQGDRGEAGCIGGGCGQGGCGQGPASGEVFVAVAGVQGQALSWFPVGALRSCSRGEVAAVVCHPGTGALLDVGDALATRAYRPGERLIRLVRQRDGGCRFPGCSVSARQCDLDHVVPWPHGPTAASNLVCLCRRHHRVKQRYRWQVRLRADGVMEWLDPAGQCHRSEPVDHLGGTQERVLDTGAHLGAGHRHDSGEQVDRGDRNGDRTTVEDEDAGLSLLEQTLGILVEHAVGRSTAVRSTAGQPTAGRSTVGPSSVSGGPSPAGGWGGRCPAVFNGSVLSCAEIDELSRAVRAGRFADIEEAVRAYHGEAVGLETPRERQVRQGCRIDQHVPPRDHPITIKIKSRPSHRDRRAPTLPVHSPPPF